MSSVVALTRVSTSSPGRRWVAPSTTSPTSHDQTSPVVEAFHACFSGWTLNRATLLGTSPISETGNDAVCEVRPDIVAEGEPAASAVRTTPTRTFAGMADGKYLVVLVAKDGPHQGRVLSAVVPDTTQVLQRGL